MIVIAVEFVPGACRDVPASVTVPANVEAAFRAREELLEVVYGSVEIVLSGRAQRPLQANNFLAVSACNQNASVLAGSVEGSQESVRRAFMLHELRDIRRVEYLRSV